MPCLNVLAEFRRMYLYVDKANGHILPFAALPDAEDPTNVVGGYTNLCSNPIVSLRILPRLSLTENLDLAARLGLSRLHRYLLDPSAETLR